MYAIEHLPGRRKFWMYFLTIWDANLPPSLNAVNIVSFTYIMYARVNPVTDSRIYCPKIEQMNLAQTDSTETSPADFSNNGDGCGNGNEILCIPSKNELFKVRILIAAHKGHKRHRIWRVTFATVQVHFQWNKMISYIE